LAPFQKKKKKKKKYVAAATAHEKLGLVGVVTKTEFSNQAVIRRQDFFEFFKKCRWNRTCGFYAKVAMTSTELNTIGMLEVLHADQAPRYTIVGHPPRVHGMLTWREFTVQLDVMCPDAETARRALAEQALKLHTNARQYAPLPSRIAPTTNTSAAVRSSSNAPAEKPVRESKTTGSAPPAKQSAAATPSHGAANPKASLSDEAVRSFCISAKLARDHAERSAVHARVADNSHLLLIGAYALPLLGNVGATITIRAARTNSIDHIDTKAPFVITCRPLRRERDKSLLCTVTNGTAPEPYIGQIKIAGPYVEQFLYERDIIFYITANIKVSPQRSPQPPPQAQVQPPPQAQVQPPQQAQVQPPPPQAQVQPPSPQVQVQPPQQVQVQPPQQVQVQPPPQAQVQEEVVQWF
jgi:hypothetical protein